MNGVSYIRMEKTFWYFTGGLWALERGNGSGD